MAPIPDSYPGSNFRVEIDGIIAGGFSEILGLDLSIDIVDYRTGTTLQSTAERLPGLVRFENITLKRGLTQNIDLWNWVKNILIGVADKRSMVIVLQDAQHNDLVTWNIVNAWPCKWSGPVLKAGSSEIAIESMEICHEGFQLAVP